MSYADALNKVTKKATAAKEKKKKPAKVGGSILQIAIADVKKRAKKGAEYVDDLYLLSDRPPTSAVRRRLKTRIPSLNDVFGGGVPEGHTIEVFGPQMGGKSALGDIIIQAAIDAGGNALVQDFEVTNDYDRAVKQGLYKSDRVAYFQPDHAENAWAVIWSFIRAQRSVYRKLKKDGKESTTPPLVVVWDSIGSTWTREQMENNEGGEGGKQTRLESGKAEQPAAVARVMTPKINAVLKKLKKYYITLVFINHEKVKIGGGGGFGGFPEKYTPGGDGVKYNNVMRVRCSASKLPVNKKVKTGMRVYVQTVKNKTALPFQRSAFILDFNRGPSAELTAFDHLKENSVLKPVPGEAGKYKFPLAKRISRGKFTARMREDPAFRDAVWKLVAEHQPDPESDG